MVESVHERTNSGFDGHGYKVPHLKSELTGNMRNVMANHPKGIPTPPHERQLIQQWMVGQRVRVTKMMERCLRSVPKQRLTVTGRISKAYVHFAKTDEMRRVVYEVLLDTEILGSTTACICPGYDSLRVELL